MYRVLYFQKVHSPLPARCRLSMALDAAKGMNYLHTSDPPVIHRDLKSPNLLVDKHWRVKARPASEPLAGACAVHLQTLSSSL